MTIGVTQAFAKQHSDEVHESYQRRGSKLRNAVRIQSVTAAANVTWQKVGRGTATTKAHNNLVPLMDVAYTSITATLVDYYAGESSGAGVVTIELLCTSGKSRGPTKLKVAS